ncbi:MAG: hypothetical protein ABIY51_07875 [Ferruginibacter sp.]
MRSNLLIVSGCLLALTLFSCQKESSEENDGGTDPSIIGLNCRIAKIDYQDTSGLIPTGSLAANINASDNAVTIIEFDSLSNFIISFADIVTIADTFHVNADEYFIRDATSKQIIKFHGLVDPGNPASPFYDQLFTYNTNGNLIKKTKALSSALNIPYEQVDYNYSGGNMVSMTYKNLFTGQLESDASLTFYSSIIPKNYIYIFPDEEERAAYNQFFNFGKRSFNAMKDIKVRYYDGTGALLDSAVSQFTNYQQSVDMYVVKVSMSGDAQPGIPAQPGRLQFSYKCH